MVDHLLERRGRSGVEFMEWSMGLQGKVEKVVKASRSKSQATDIQLASEVMFEAEKGFVGMSEVVNSMESYSNAVSCAVLKSCNQLEVCSNAIVKVCNQEPVKGVFRGEKERCKTGKQVAKRKGILKEKRKRLETSDSFKKQVSFSAAKVYTGPIWEVGSNRVEPWAKQKVAPWAN